MLFFLFTNRYKININQIKFQIFRKNIETRSNFFPAF